jgi:FixJ family two-component response regulator
MEQQHPVVFVVDDDPAVCSALRRLIRSVGLEVETFTSARDFLHAKHVDGPGCVVLDVRMPDLSGLNLQEKLAEANMDLPIIFITGFADIPMTVRAMKAGAVEFLTKPINDQQLLDAMQLGIEKHRRQLVKRGELTELQTRYQSLTNRERQVFPLVASGYLNKQVAAELGTSEKTVKIHRSQVMVKMKAGSVADLVHMAAMLGLHSSHDTAA